MRLSPPAHTGPPRRQQWQSQVGTWVDQAPATDAEGDLYVRDLEGQVSAYERGTGELKWKQPANKLVPLADGTLLDHQGDSLRALDPATGQPRWEIFLGDKVKGPILGDRGEILVADKPEDRTQHRLRRLDPATGATLWTRPLPDLRARPIQVVDGRVYTLSNVPLGNEFAAFDAGTGEPIFAVREHDVNSFEVRDGKVVYVSIERRAEGNLMEVRLRDGETGELKWSHRPKGDLRTAPTFTLDGSKALIFEAKSGDRTLTEVRALEAETGEKGWGLTTGLGRKLAHGPNGELFFSHVKFDRQSGTTIASQERIDPQTGRVLWTATESSQPRWLRVTGAGDLLTVTPHPEGSTVRAYGFEDGALLWERTTGVVSAVELGPENQVHLLEGGCQMVVLDSRSGAEKETLHTGDSLNLGEPGADGAIPVSDYEGRLALVGTGAAGQLPSTEPVGHLRSSYRFAIQRRLGAGSGFNYLDWDSNGAYDTKNDPKLLLDRDGSGAIEPAEFARPMTRTELRALDQNSDWELREADLGQVYFWFDDNGDGLPSEGEEAPRLAVGGEPFNKARLDLIHWDFDLSNGGCS